MKNLLEYASRGSLMPCYRSVLTDGKGRGMRLLRLANGILDLTLSEDRGLDILYASYKGKNLGFLSANGPVSPSLCFSGAYGFAECFPGGLLYTCGLDNAGAPEKGVVQHGSYTALLSEYTNLRFGDEGGIPWAEAEGIMRFSALFGGELTLTRKIKLFYGQPEIIISDVLENTGFKQKEYMLLYHFNFGYPVTCEDTATEIGGIVSTEYLSAAAERGAGGENGFYPPLFSREEEVFVHTLNGSNGRAAITGGGVRAELFFDAGRLPYLVHWKSGASGDYVTGIEPSTVNLKAKKTLSLSPGERREYLLKLRLSDN